MAALGRKGGTIGGHARAQALSPARREAIARAAAQKRWRRPVLTSSSRLDLAALVAHGGSRASPVELPETFERHVLRALQASRRDSSLARMLPVFLWRTRKQLDLRRLVREARSHEQRVVLGFFLELTAELGGTRLFDEAIGRLRASSRPARPGFFFLESRHRPWEQAAAEAATPEVARRWGLLMNMPRDSFASYFEKTASL
jgi:hypothetical protein